MLTLFGVNGCLEVYFEEAVRDIHEDSGGNSLCFIWNCFRRTEFCDIDRYSLPAAIVLFTSSFRSDQYSITFSHSLDSE